MVFDDDGVVEAKLVISAEKSLSLRRNCIAKWRRGLIDKVGKNLSHKNSITLAREMQASLPSHGIRIFSFIINGVIG